MHVIAITAHPDDAEIYLGGSLLAWRDGGARTTIMIATDGRFGGKGDPDALAAARKDEALECGGWISGGSDNVLIGGPSVQVRDINAGTESDDRIDLASSDNIFADLGD